MEQENKAKSSRLNNLLIDQIVCQRDGPTNFQQKSQHESRNGNSYTFHVQHTFKPLRFGLCVRMYLNANPNYNWGTCVHDSVKHVMQMSVY